MARVKTKTPPQPRVARLRGDGAVQVSAAEAAIAQDPARRRPERSALGSDLEALQDRFAHDVIGATWLPEDLTGEERARKVDAALLMFARLDPRDEAEAMLAVQMVASHNAAMECQRRAMLTGQSFEGRDLALRNAAKMSTLFERQLAAYDKRRGRRDQTVVVKHVTVQDGGQAIVGDVHASGVSGAGRSSGAASISHRNDAAFDGQAVTSGREEVPGPSRCERKRR